MPERPSPAAPFGVYVHIPFCKTLCPYCDFVRTRVPGNVPQEYVEAVCREIASFPGPDAAASVFLGGGTPSLLDPGDLASILDATRERFILNEPEITIEANPDDVTPSLAAAWNGLGVNRVSLGVQSFDDEVLRTLGRRHDAACARRACETVASLFPNWTMDLIFGAGSSEAWESTLQQCLALRPAHVSTYGITYEPGTPFAQRRNDAIDDDTWLSLYRRAENVLADYDHYEISNYARPGYECRHNLLYWHNDEYAGCGAGAYSFVQRIRSRNPASLHDYLANPGAKEEALSLEPAEIRLETVIQHMRLRSGLPIDYYAARFGHSVFDDYGPALSHLSSAGLIHADAHVIRPTPKGFELNNEIGMALLDVPRDVTAQISD